jgi:ABC-2 type transport system permease protein/sodium transport system permease protein
LFGGLPFLAAYLGRVRIRESFRLRGTSWVAYLAALLLLLGVALWPFAFEIIMYMQDAGLVSFHHEYLEKVGKAFRIWQALSPVWLLLTFAVVPALVEELFFRGYLFSALRAYGNPRTAILGSAVLFGVFHLIVTDSLAFERFVPTTLLGVVLGWVCWKTGSVFPGMVLHVCHNGLLILAAYYQDDLARLGWGVADESHIPWTWLGIAAAAAGLGAWLIYFAYRTPRADAVPTKKEIGVKD